MSTSVCLPAPTLSNVCPNLNGPFDASHWSQYFQRNLATPVSVPWDAETKLSKIEKAQLAKTLSVFQLGETGEGRVLLRFARRLKNDPRFEGYEEALRLFIDEEKRHAALLAQLILRRFDGELRSSQWSDSLFRSVRHLINLEFELQILLTAELIAYAYYGLIYQNVDDPVVNTICGKIIRDEVQHIRFHSHFFGTRQRTWPSAARWVWRKQFWFVAKVMMTLVWRSHRKQLTEFGIRRIDFHRRANRAAWGFLSS
ncbi:MAG: ferritin-like domain-containing protein [Verrucomicrobiota bacterium]